jgi:hypothetical protein
MLLRAAGRNEDRTPKARVLSSFLPAALNPSFGVLFRKRSPWPLPPQPRRIQAVGTNRRRTILLVRRLAAHHAIPLPVHFRLAGRGRQDEQLIKVIRNSAGIVSFGQRELPRLGGGRTRFSSLRSGRNRGRRGIGVQPAAG